MKTYDKENMTVMEYFLDPFIWWLKNPKEDMQISSLSGTVGGFVTAKVEHLLTIQSDNWALAHVTELLQDFSDVVSRGTVSPVVGRTLYTPATRDRLPG